MPSVSSGKISKHPERFPTPVNPLYQGTEITKRALLFTTSPTTQDLIDAIHNDRTILIEDKTLKHGLKGFEGPLGDLALSLTTLTAYIIDIVAVIDHFLLHKTFLHPVLCEQILTSTHEVVANAILWSNLEVDCPNNRQKSLDFSDLIKERLKNKILTKRLLKINLHLNPQWIEVSIISTGKGFEWTQAVSKISSDFQGLSIVQSFADEVTSTNNGNVLKLKFYT